MKTTRGLLGARIKELRKTRQLSQDELSEKINIDPKHLSRIEVGKSYPSLVTLEKIAVALDVEMKAFFEFMHLSNNKELDEDIGKLLTSTSDANRRLICKIIRSIICG